MRVTSGESSRRSRRRAQRQTLSTIAASNPDALEEILLYLLCGVHPPSRPPFIHEE